MAWTVGPKDTVFIVTKPEPPISIKMSANDLQALLPMRTGAAVKVVDAAPVDAKAIYLAAKDGSKLASDGFVIEVNGNRIDIYGNDSQEHGSTSPFNFYFNVKSRGTFNGVWRFFTQFCQIDQIAPGRLGLCVPAPGEVSIADGIVKDAPVFMMRNTTDVYEFRYGRIGYLDREEYMGEFKPELQLWATRIGLSSRMFPVVGCHSVSNLELFKNFGEQYPAYFSLQKNGTRGGLHGSLCWSNPDVTKMLFSLADAFFSGKRPSDAGLTLKEGNHWPVPFSLGKDEFMVDPSDEFAKNICQCPRCKGKTPEEICEQVWMRLSEVAELVEAKYPGKIISTLAYPPKLEPPSFPLPKNIRVRLTMPGPNGLADEVTHQYYLNLLKKWHGLLQAPIPVWLYFVAHEYGTSGTVETSPENYQQFLREIRPYCNSVYFEFPTKTQAQRNFELYMHSKLLWNPEVDIEQVKADYCRKGYAEGADEIKEFYDRLEDLWQRILKETWDRGDGRIPSLIDGNWRKNKANRHIFKHIYTGEELTTLSQLLDKAKSKVLAGSIYARRIDLLQKYIVDFAVKERESVMYSENAMGKTELTTIVLDKTPTQADWDEASWQKLGNFVEDRDKGLKCAGKFKLLLDQDNLYVRAELREPLIAKSKTVPNHTEKTIKDIWKDNDFELFFKNKGVFRQFICNDLGQFIFNDVSPGAYSRYRGNVEGVKVDARRGEDKWLVEVTLPHYITGIIPTDTDSCRFNVIRSRNIQELPTEYSTWSSAVNYGAVFDSDAYGRLVWTASKAMKQTYENMAKPPTDEPMELLHFFSFDEDPGKTWYHWKHPDMPPKHSYDAQYGHDKAGALKIEYPAKTSGSYSYWIQVKPGDRVRITAWVRHTSGTVSCACGFMDSNNRWVDFGKLGGQVKVPSFGKWVKCSWEATVPDRREITQMTAGFSSPDTPATLWIDDVKIEIKR